MLLLFETGDLDHSEGVQGASADERGMSFLKIFLWENISYKYSQFQQHLVKSNEKNLFLVAENSRITKYEKRLKSKNAYTTLFMINIIIKNILCHLFTPSRSTR